MEQRRDPNELPGIVVPEFDNWGLGPLLVPGFSRMPLYLDVEAGKRRFAHAFDDNWHWPWRATAREIAMLRCMEEVTDRLNWHEDIFSEEKIAEWREAIKTNWRISDKAWAWCVLELRDKARRFIKTGRTVVFDYATGAVCKVDLYDDKLPGLLKGGVEEVIGNEPAKGRPRPDSVARIVDAHLAPLIYGQTNVLSEGGAIGLEDMDDWYGQGLPSTRAEDLNDYSPLPRNTEGTPDYDARTRRWDALGTLSPGFQWLPCEVAFTDDMESPVQITSYINDLHPRKQAPIYSTIEKAIATAIDSWNDVLVLTTSSRTLPFLEPSGRIPTRIKTYGVQYPFSLPSLEDEFREARPLLGDSELEPTTSDILASLTASVRMVEDEVSRGIVGSRAQVYPGPGRDWPYLGRDFWDSTTRRLIHPEPGVSFSYEEWKTGRNVTRAIFPKARREGEPEVHVDHDYYSVSLQDEFRDRGLQVVVRIDSIELTPDTPRFEDDKDEWGDEIFHAADGMATDYVAATTIIFFDLDNVNPMRIRFQQPSHLYENNFSEAEHKDFYGVMEVFDLDYSDLTRDDLCQLHAHPQVQELGRVVASEGRMLSFPGPVMYRFDPCELVDASKPGHARYLALYLVDPNFRVCSTRNVPPQRLDWWAYDVLRKAPKGLGDLPSELFDQIVTNADVDGIMDAEALERVRDAMEEERRENANTIRDEIGWYRFCEDIDHVN